MNYLAPRQGIFAVILLVSFCLHLLAITVSMEKQQYDYRTDKGEKIVEQLSKEALVSVENQDRISLSVLANRYQVDNDVARLDIFDAQKNALVQIGTSQNEMGEVIEQPIIQDNTQIGTISITMRASANGELLALQWIFILASLILHIFLWLMYRLVARPTKKQLEAIGEKLQERLVITRQGLVKNMPATSVMDEQKSDDKPVEIPAEKAETKKSMGQNIQNYLQKNRQQTVETSENLDNATQTDSEHEVQNFAENQPHQPILQNPNRAKLPTDSLPKEHSVTVQIRFVDEFKLLSRLTPEVAVPYLQLCEQLLLRACDRLFIAHESGESFNLKSVNLKQLPHFDEHGAVVHLTGKNEEVVLASVLLAKLVLILNQVVYEKHRELSRFSLPMTVGVSIDNKTEDMKHLMNNHAREDSLLMLYPKALLKFLDRHVQYKHTNQPMSISEREMVRYHGLSQALMKDLIAKRDEILTSTER